MQIIAGSEANTGPSLAEYTNSLPDRIPGHWRDIQPRRGWSPIDLGELWQYRELLYFLMWRDIKVRYKQTALGAAWAVLQPLLAMAIFTLIFGRFAHIPSDGVPYALFAYCGLVPWTFFAYALTQTSQSLVSDANLISKVYFPRLVIPISATLAGCMDLAIAFVVLVIMAAGFHIAPTPAIATLPLFVALALVTALAVGTWLSALNVQYRDIRYTIPFLTQFWLFSTPIAYPSSMIHGKMRLILSLNPMTGVVDGFRWAVLGRGDIDIPSLLLSSSAMLVVLVTGLIYFRRMERRFADVV